MARKISKKCTFFFNNGTLKFLRNNVLINKTYFFLKNLTVIKEQYGMKITVVGNGYVRLI